MNYLIGIDDTDDLESRGTGHRVRQLAECLRVDRLAEPRGITRHQLLIDPQIPYTSHNSSACMSIETDEAEGVWETARDFLLHESAPGSDAGLCLAQWDSIGPGAIEFGRRAKVEVLTILEAERTASTIGMQLAGLMGTGGGVIGALAAVGLHRGGHDGRFLWLPGLRELTGKYPVSEILAKAHVDGICTRDGKQLAPDVLVDVGEWVRPVLVGGQAVLYVEEKNHEWHVLAKGHIKDLSN